MQEIVTWWCVALIEMAKLEQKGAVITPHLFGAILDAQDGMVI